MKVFVIKFLTLTRITEIPGPTRKAPPKQHTPSDTNEIQGKGSNNKNHMTTMKESHPTPPKSNFHPDYDDTNYSFSEDDDVYIGMSLQSLGYSTFSTRFFFSPI